MMLLAKILNKIVLFLVFFRLVFVVGIIFFDANLETVLGKFIG